MSKTKLEQKNIGRYTKSKLIKKDESDIKTPWFKLCSHCNDPQYYSSRGSLTRAIKKNAVHYRCSKLGEKHHYYHKHLSDEHKEKLSKSLSGHAHTKEFKENLSKSRMGSKNPQYGKIGPNLNKSPSAETRRKIRVSVIKQLKRCVGQLYPIYNLSSIPILNEINEQLGWNLQHAENGGEFHIKELGYWLDGYDKDRNIVVEYHENKHFKNGKLKDRDVIRQEEITKFLGCKFYWIKEGQDWQKVIK